MFQGAAERLAAIAAESSADVPSRYESWVGPDRVTSYPFGTPLVVQIA